MTAQLATDHRTSRRGATAFGLSIGLIAAVLGGVLAGAADVGLGDVAHVIGFKLGLVGDERLADGVLWAVRIPRVLAAALAGGLLAACGAALQGVLRNDMADPQLVGILPVAGLGGVVGIALGGAGSTEVGVMVGGAIAGSVAALLIRRVAMRIGDPSQFVLVGLVLGLTALAWLGAVVAAWDSPLLPTFSFWVFGGLSGATWSLLGAALPLAVAAGGVLAAVARRLDLVALGEREARHLGVDVGRVSSLTLVGCGLAAGAAVGLAGIVGFVGLVVPLSLRNAIGPSHGWLISLSALGGAAAVVVLDTVARTIVAPVEIPVGLLTAGLGGPVFVWALLRSHRWAQ